MNDARFKHIQNDPKFRRIPKSEKKVKIDKRFHSMFNEDKFKIKYTVDKRGRPVNHSSTEDLKRYYALSSDESDQESENELEKIDLKVKDKKNESKHKANMFLTKDVKLKLKDLNVDYARGESTLYSESSSDDESEEEDKNFDNENEIDHKWGELDAEADVTDDITHRLAVCNMDWDRIKAVDLMVLFNSFLPVGGVIKSVNIYPSEFGKKRMAEEDIKGPIELVDVKDDNDETSEGSTFHMEKLRQYQLNRLKYYYAVVVFDSPTSANKVYGECDGMEYESSATKIDVRFIPDDMTFDDEPKETCDKLPDLNKYEPRFFTTTALQQAKVDLTWDETNPERIDISHKLNSGKIDDISEMDLQNYLAGSSEEESNDEENETITEEGGDAIEKYKNLLQDIKKKENSKKNNDVEMEVTWGLGLKEDVEKAVKKKIVQNEVKTPFQQYLEKRKEKRKEKKQKNKNINLENETESDIPSDIDMKDSYFAEEFDKSEFKSKKLHKSNVKTETLPDAELELLLMNEDDNKHFNFKNIHSNDTKKGKKSKNKINEFSDDFEIDVNDSRFSALYTSHHFNIDPSDPRYKKTKGMENLISEKLKRRNTQECSGNKKQKLEKKKDAQLTLLVKSVKRNTEGFKRK